ncbi:hypothetical protein HK14_12425 [Acetobacter cibinongensis]|uniref:Uncharacterized protein n=1 Tax=Acetobacter cibinongensis TaxID=146475 RepID=A0A1Z5YS18_9PROT|nr:hypothetical protein HK14_12425 [Acetobacter cibinongensis]
MRRLFLLTKVLTYALAMNLRQTPRHFAVLFVIFQIFLKTSVTFIRYKRRKIYADVVHLCVHSAPPYRTNPDQRVFYT